MKPKKLFLEMSQTVFLVTYEIELKKQLIIRCRTRSIFYVRETSIVNLPRQDVLMIECKCVSKIRRNLIEVLKYESKSKNKVNLPVQRRSNRPTAKPTVVSI